MLASFTWASCVFASVNAPFAAVFACAAFSVSNCVRSVSQSYRIRMRSQVEVIRHTLQLVGRRGFGSRMLSRPSLIACFSPGFGESLIPTSEMLYRSSGGVERLLIVCGSGVSPCLRPGETSRSGRNPSPGNLREVFLVTGRRL